MRKRPYNWLSGTETFADATLRLCAAGESINVPCGESIPVHRNVLASHSEYFRSRLLRWPASGSQSTSEFQPSIAVAQFNETGSLPPGLNASQLAQMCKEAQAQEKQDCVAACMQAIVDLALEKPCDLKPPLPCLEEVLDSQAECEAARLVVRCMYEGDVADEAKDPETLAMVCRVAERWACSSLTSKCLLKLADLPSSQLPAEQLVLVLQTLPDSCALLLEHAKWLERVHTLAASLATGLSTLPLLLHLYGDVHAVITSTQLRDYVRQLPFAAVQLWAGSDELTVDSENSVVELLSLWMAGPRGQACTVEQQQQLSCLVRVQHLSPSFAQGWLPGLRWFNVPGAPTAGVALAATCGFGLDGVLPIAPPVWSAPPRKELCHDELLRRTTIRWDVPRQQLVDLLASKDATTRVYSEPVYSAGTGWRVFIMLNPGEQGNDGQPGFTLGCYGELVPYAQCNDHALGAESPLGNIIDFGIVHGGALTAFAGRKQYVYKGCGYASLLGRSLHTAADLEPFLVNGCLQITAAFQVAHRPGQQ
ncbi:hypothetical protein V8C86DRAFT_3131566 [Haematococcus lacustris]